MNGILSKFQGSGYVSTPLATGTATITAFAPVALAKQAALLEAMASPQIVE